MELQVKVLEKILHTASSAAGTRHTRMLERETGIFPLEARGTLTIPLVSS